MAKTWLWGAAAAALIVSAAAAAEHGPVYPPFGFDLSATDKSVKPGDDFFQYANGRYLARAVIPSDRPSVSRRLEMTDRMEAQLHTLMEEAARGAAPGASDTKAKVGAFYAAFMDEAQAERLGAAPLKPVFVAIRAAPDRAALAALTGQA